MPERRAGQVWHVQYSGWNGTREHAYYLLLRRHVPQRYHPDNHKEAWWVWDLEKGKMGYADGYPMPFDEADEHGDWELPYYRLFLEAPGDLAASELP